jgi:hypothetical protein
MVAIEIENQFKFQLQLQLKESALTIRTFPEARGASH